MKVALTMIPMCTDRYEDEIHEFFPMAVYLLASYIRKEKIDVDILTYDNFNEVNIEEMAQYNLIGFSCNTFNYAESCEIAKLVKCKNRNVNILFGGIHVTHKPIEAIENSYVDFVIKGEGEQVIVSLIKYQYDAKALGTIPGLCYKVNSKIFNNEKGVPQNLDNTSFLPAYDLVKLDTIDYLQIETSRSCQNRCIFCSVDKDYNWRGFSSDEVLDRLEKSLSMISKKAKIKTIITTDDCFTTDIDRAIKILQGIKEKYPQISIRIEARVKDLMKSEELLFELSKTNLSVIQVGVECGYDIGLNLIRKGVNVKEIRKCAQLLHKWDLGKKVYFSYIVGLPWEGKDECFKTIEFANEIFDKYHIPGNIVLWQPLPSELANKYGLEKDKWYKKKGWWKDSDIFLEAHHNLSIGDINDITARIKQFTFKSYSYLGVPFN